MKFKTYCKSKKTFIQVFYKTSEIKETGYYWWLPECLKEEPDNPINWNATFIIVNSYNMDLKGVFVGPLIPPVFESKEKFK